MRSPIAWIAWVLLAGWLVALPAAAEGQGLVHAEHPLVGKVWSVEAGAFVGRETLAREAARARFVMLGETHDNPVHHRLQAALLEAAVRDEPAVLALEMVNRAQQPALDDWRAAGGDPARFAEATRWTERGWPDFAIYEPVIETAREAGLPIRGANLGREAVRTAAREGREALPAPVRSAMDRYRPGAADRERMAAIVREGHCNLLPEAAIPGMVTAQRARDAAMAATLAGVDGRAVLVTGAGHARKDIGVPAYLADAPGTLLSVAFVEVDEDAAHPAAYAEAFGVDRLPFDYAWFTPRQPREDPCAGLERHLEGHAD